MQRLTKLRWPWLLVVLAIGLAGPAAACGGDDDSPGEAADGNATSTPEGDDSGPAFRGVQIAPPPIKPDLVLTDTSGQPYDIQAETEGQLTLLYLGYTNCPDVCPTFMSDLAAVKKQLDPAVAEKITVLFVTTDPERDTPEVIGTWLSAFDKEFVGLTGDAETLVRLQLSMGMPAAEKEDLGNGNYGVNHGSYVLAFTPDDNVAHMIYPLGFTRADWLHDLEKLVTEGWSAS